MPATKHALLRYRVIDKCLRNKYRPFPSVVDLQKACEEVLYGSSGQHVSISTIEKDLRDMRENQVLGYYAPIRYSKQERGYYYDDETYSIDRKPLSAQEVDAIQFAAGTLFHFREAGVFSLFSSAVEKIFEQLHMVNSLDDPDIRELMQFEAIPKARGLEWMKTLYEAIRQRRELWIDYRKFGAGDAMMMVFHPYLLREFRNRWYLIGYSTSRSKVISLGLDRIHAVSFTGDEFKRIPSFDPGEYFRDSYGITEGGLVAERVVLSFDQGQGPYLMSQPIHESQKVLVNNDLEFRVELFVRVNYELRQMILGYGPEVKVLEPLSLRDEVRSLHLRAAEDWR